VKTLVSIIATCFSFLSFSWGESTTFVQTFGGRGEDCGYCVVQTNDGGYAIAGSTTSYGAGKMDVYVIKTDASGEQLWHKTIGSELPENANSIQQTKDGGFIIVGKKQPHLGRGVYSSDVYLIKTDRHGNPRGTKTYGGEGFDEGWSVQQTKDGGYIIAGMTDSYGKGCWDVYLIKTDAQGNELWWNVFGGKDCDPGRCVRQTHDGGYIICGHRGSGRGSEPDMYLIKTDADGNEIWSRTFGGSKSEIGHCVNQTKDGGYIIAGAAWHYGDLISGGNSDVYVVKTDSMGNETWSRQYGGDDQESAGDVQQTSDGGFIIVGNARSYGADDKKEPDVYLIRLDTEGQEIWMKTFGGTEYDYGYGVIQTSDGGYVICGKTQSFGDANYDLLLIKTDEQGNVE